MSVGDSPLTRASLLVQLRDGANQDAWQEFMRLYGPLVYGFARKRGLQDADAADLMQDVLRSVSSAIGRLDYDRAQGTFRGWLFTITRNKIFNFLSARRARQQNSGDGAPSQLLDNVPDASDGADVWELEYQRRLAALAMQRIQPEFQQNTWQAFSLTAVEGMAAPDVARQLGMTPGAIYVAKSRVLARLKEEVEAMRRQEEVNMKTGTVCPQTEELRQLLNSSLSGERNQECTQHLDSCECCQARLEEIATEGTKLSQVVQRLQEAEPMATSAYWPAIKALETGVVQAITPRVAPRSAEVSLAFLQPASDTAYLGRLAQFDVMRVLGRGGMGVVLEAFDSRLQRNVAIKVLDPDLAGDDVARQRFCREARAAASITHENVVAVHQVERAGENSLPYLVMQVVNGESLEQRLTREGTLPLREIVRIGMQAAHGLAAAHAQGLIHRDIKPGNILLEAPQDRVKLTDFGLARVAEDVKLTRTGYVSGTPLYMAPEQALDLETDHRADLFSLGAILYEMCAGRPPFTGNSVLAILKQIADTKHRPLREIDPNTPQWLSETIDRLLAKLPEDRIQTAAELAELFDFHSALLKTTSEELPSVCQVAVKKRARRNRMIAVGVGATFLAVGLFAGAFLFNRGGPAEAVSSAEPVAVLAANAGAVWSVSFDPTSKIVAMGVEDGSVRLWDLRTQSVKATFDAHRGAVWNAKFAPTGELLATTGDDNQIKIWDPSQNEALKVFKQDNAVRGLAFSHDGMKIYGGDRNGGLRVWSLDADEPLVEARQPGAIYSVAVSPNGETLATAGSDKVVRLWNAKSLTSKLTLEGHNGPINGLAFHPDGKRLASVGWDRTVRIWDVASGQLLKSCSGHSGEIWGIAWSPDGKKLATGGHDGAVKLWETDTGTLLGTYLGHKAAIHTVTFNPDGSLLASGGRDGAVRVWMID